MMFHYSEHYAEYLPKLIGMLQKNELKVSVDLGHNTIGGEFNGIDSIVRAVEVIILVISDENFDDLAHSSTCTPVRALAKLWSK